MTVAVSINLSDGAVLAVDSAVTIPTAGGAPKVYENAEKLFILDSRPIGVAVYGLGSLGQRGIGSYLRQFETTNPNNVVSGNTSMAEVAEAIRVFFLAEYMKEVAPLVAKQAGTPFDQVPLNQRPALGIILGGYSYGEYMSEIWEVIVPIHDQPNSARCARKRGEFGANWYALYQPIARYLFGMDEQMATNIIKFVENRGGPLSPQESADLDKVLRGGEYQIPFAAMPIHEGVDHARFLVNLVIGHHRYTVSSAPGIGGALVVGGKVQIGRVSYKDSQFVIMSSQGE